MSNIIITTPLELETLIQDTIRKAINEAKVDQTESCNELLTISEASNFLNLAKQTLYGFTSKNLIPFIKKGKKLYFRKSDLEKWLLEGKQLTRTEIENAGFGLLNNKKRGSK